MFIRTKVNTLKNKTKKASFSLCECRRVNGQPKQATLLNLGADFPIKKDKWSILIERVVGEIKHHPVSVFEQDEQMDYQVNRIVRALKDMGYNPYAVKDDRTPVIFDKVEDLESRTIGGERVVNKALSLLGFDEMLTSLGFSDLQKRIAHMLVASRCLAPANEADTYRWLHQRSSLFPLLQLDDNPPSLSSLYQVGDMLYTHRETLIKKLFTQSQSVFGFTPCIAFYDLTNTYHYGKQDDELLAYGRSKEKRSNRVLASIAMVIDASGFPTHAEIYKGNISELKTLEKAIKDIGIACPTVIMDARISTKKNIEFLNQKGIKWLRIERNKKQPPPKTKPDSTHQTDSGSAYSLWEVSQSQEVKRVLVQSGPRKQARDNHLKREQEKLEEELTRLNKGLSNPRCMRDYLKIVEKVGILKKKHQKVAYQYDIEVTPLKDSDLASSVRFTRNKDYDHAIAKSGYYVIATTQTDWEAEQMVYYYHQLGDMERTFRTLKSELGLRPIVHQRVERIKAHLFITILAYYVVHLVRMRLKEKGINLSWDDAGQELLMQKRTTTKIHENKNRYHLLSKDGALSPIQKIIYEAIDLPISNHLRYRTVNKEE